MSVDEELESLRRELEATNLAVGTLIVWLQPQLGTKNCEDILKMLGTVKVMNADIGTGSTLQGGDS